MRLMGIDCVELNNESFRHSATITNTLTEEDDIYWNKLLSSDDLPKSQKSASQLTGSQKQLNESVGSQKRLFQFGRSSEVTFSNESFGDDADELMQRTFNRDLPLTNNRQSLVVQYLEIPDSDSETDISESADTAISSQSLISSETSVSTAFSNDDTLEEFWPSECCRTRQIDPSLTVPTESVDELVPCPLTLSDHPLYCHFVDAEFINVSEQTEIEVVRRYLEQQQDAVYNALDIDKPRTAAATRRYLYGIDTRTRYGNDTLTISDALSPADRGALHSLIQQHVSQIASHWADCGLIEGIYMKLDLKPGSQPFRQRPYRQSFPMMKEIEAQTEKLLKAGFIRPSNSEFASAVTMVPKKLVNETVEWRMCNDFRLLNSMTVRDRYPLPNITTLHSRFHGNHFFTALDLRHGYHHIEIRPEDRHKTAFITHQGLYEWIRMSFGFVNAPATFQRAMDYIFRNCSFVIVYIDDILILSATKEEHWEHIRVVFGLLQRYNLKIRIGKCFFFQTELKYLGFILSGEGVRPDREYVRRIWELKAPTVSQPVKRSFIKRMIGMIQWLHRYIPRLADYLAPINQLTKTAANQQLVWTPECDASLTKVKTLVRDAPLLRHPDLSRPFHVVCDASDLGIGSVLMQKHNSVLEPCEYWSRKFNDTEAKWHVSEKELSAIVYSLEKWEKYLLGPHFHVYTDHRNLEELHRRVEAETLSNSKLNRWFVRIEMFDFTAHYIKGIHNIAADYLSRDALMETAQHHLDQHNPNRSFAAKPLRGKRHVFFVDIVSDAVSDGDELIQIVDGNVVRHCYIVQIPAHHVNELRRSPRIAAKQRALQALRDSAVVNSVLEQMESCRTFSNSVYPKLWGEKSDWI